MRNNERKIRRIEQEAGAPVDDILEWGEQISEGQKKISIAKKELINANLRLVVSIAKKRKQSRIRNNNKLNNSEPP